MPLMMKRLIHTGSTLRPRSAGGEGGDRRRAARESLAAARSGRCKPVIDSVFALAEVAKAHARMESSAHVGKIVLTI